MHTVTMFNSRGKIKIIAVLVTVITLSFVVLTSLSNSGPVWCMGEHECSGSEDSSDDSSLKSEKSARKTLTEKIVHLDLKGAAPSVSYFKEFFPYIKKLGATGLLIEYEDMFPYKDELDNIKALNAYSPSQITEILDLAESNGLSVIPLIQTFAHFEFVLKLKEYRHLREIDAYPQMLCPSHEAVFPVLQKMIDQILEAHPKSKYIHVGCDEVFDQGECTRCKKVMETNNWKRNHLLLNHVKRVAQYIIHKYPKVRPIMWNDMLINERADLIKEYKLGDMVDIMVWSYKQDVSQDVPDNLLQLYSQLFKSIWIASCYKGSTGVDQIVVDASYHLANHKSWMNLVSKWEGKINFKGIALTGWQRYDHFSVLCELLPVSIPSLTLALHYLNKCTKVTEHSVMKILQCNFPIALTPSDLMYLAVPECRFPGFSIYSIISRFYIFIKQLKLPTSNAILGWMSAYNVVNKYSNPSHIESYFLHRDLNETRKRIRIFEKDLRKALSTVYDEYTVNEWIASKVTVLRIWLDAVYYSKAALLEQKEWPRRPLLNNTDDILQNSINGICSSENKNMCGLFLNMKLGNPI